METPHKYNGSAHAALRVVKNAWTDHGGEEAMHARLTRMEIVVSLTPCGEPLKLGGMDGTADLAQG